MSFCGYVAPIPYQRDLMTKSCVYSWQVGMQEQMKASFSVRLIQWQNLHHPLRGRRPYFRKLIELKDKTMAL